MNGHKIINQNAPHYMTFTVVGWIDVFSRKAYKEVITETMKSSIADLQRVYVGVQIGMSLWHRGQETSTI